MSVKNIAFVNVNLLYTSKYNYIDFSVDENGMWMIYGGIDENNTIIMKLEPNLMQPQALLNLSANLQSMGETFIMCGVLYGINSINDMETKIQFAFDLYHLRDIPVDVRFSNPYGNNTMVSYNPRDLKIYSWDRGYQLMYPFI